MKHPAVVLAGVLLLFPAALITYRVVWLNYPLSLQAPGRTWQLAMQARIKTARQEIQLEIGLPHDGPHHKLVSEQISSGGLDFDVIRDRSDRIGIWYSQEVTEEQAFINYRASILETPKGIVGPPSDYPVAITTAEDRALAERLVTSWKKQSPPARYRAVAAALGDSWGQALPSDQDLGAWRSVREKYGLVTASLLLFRASGLPAQAVTGLQLGESVRRLLLTWLEVWTGEKWEIMMPVIGPIEAPPGRFLPLATDRKAVVVVSGELSDIRWTLRRQIISNWILLFERLRRSGDWLTRFSPFYLPREFQDTFRVLLLVPLSALLICIFRNIVGFPTFGIFMPVLLALAFRDTGLAYGLGVLAFVIAIGYLFRRVVNQLRLLLVPRLSVLLSIVIACIFVFAMLGNLYDLRQLMSVGLLPIVILTMMIERFFIVTEEAGLRESLTTAFSTALVATMTYGIINWEPLQLRFYVFPELISAVAAFQVLVGRYTGARLSEISRFKHLMGT